MAHQYSTTPYALYAMFENIDKSIINDVYAQCNRNQELAANYLLQMNSEDTQDSQLSGKKSTTKDFNDHQWDNPIQTNDSNNYNASSQPLTKSKQIESTYSDNDGSSDWMCSNCKSSNDALMMYCGACFYGYSKIQQVVFAHKLHNKDHDQDHNHNPDDNKNQLQLTIIESKMQAKSRKLVEQFKTKISAATANCDIHINYHMLSNC